MVLDANHVDMLGTDCNSRVVAKLNPLTCNRPSPQAAERLLRAEMERVNTQLENREKIARLCIVGEPWSIGNGIMTPAMKFRRHVVEQRYADWVADGRAETVVWQDPMA
jgi:hypothetical protein